MPQIEVIIDPRKAVAGAKKVTNALGSIASKAKSIVPSINPLNTAIGAIATGAGLTGLVKLGDQYTLMASQLQFATGSAEEAAKVQKELYAVSKATGTSIKDNADTYVKLTQASKLTKLSSEENIKVLGAINTLMIKTGTSGAQASAAMLQLSQALTSGRLQGDEFRSMAENAPGVLNKLAEAMGVPRSELKQMATDGELTSERLGKAFLDMSDSADASFDTLPKLAEQGWNSVVLAFQRAWDKINDDTGILGMLRDGLLNMAGWIEDNTDVFIQWAHNIIAEAKRIAPSVIDFLKVFKTTVMELGKALWDNRQQITKFLSNIFDFAKLLMSALTPVFNFLLKILGVINSVITGVKNIFTSGKSATVSITGNSTDQQTPSGGSNQRVNSATINNYFNQNLTKNEIDDISQRQALNAARL